MHKKMNLQNPDNLIVDLLSSFFGMSYSLNDEKKNHE